MYIYIYIYIRIHITIITYYYYYYSVSTRSGHPDAWPALDTGTTQRHAVVAGGSSSSKYW